jgi:nucleoside-triphosphatase
MEKRHLLITGLPGSGKTTLLVRLARRFACLHPVGFYTEQIREGGVRVGFRLVALDGRSRILAHTGLPGLHRIGRYGVDVAVFDAFLEAIGLINSTAPLVFLDEIGKMECLSARFTATVRALLDSGRPVVATVARHGEGLIAEAKGRDDCDVVEVTGSNRDELAEELAGWIGRQVKGAAACGEREVRPV